MTAADSSGPWVALTTAGRSPTTSAAIPLGSVSGGRYVLGSGVLGGRAFPDSEKGRLMRLGGALVSTSAVEDWAQLVSLGPLEPGASVTFLVAVGVTMDAMRAALDSARKATGGLDPDAEPVATGLQLLPPFPNPFDPTAGGRIKLPFLVGREGGTVQSVLEIYTISGRFVYRENRPITPSETITPFEWDGIDGAGKPAATGVYGYILRVGPESRFGKFVVLK